MKKTSVSRTQILSKIRSRLTQKETIDGREKTVTQRLKSHLPHLIPERAKQAKDDLLIRFQTMLEDQGATVIKVADMSMLPETLCTYLRDNELPLTVRHGEDPEITSLPWDLTPDLERQSGPANPDDLSSLSHAFAAAAETGTLMLLSGPQNPTTLNFLPEIHIILISQERIYGSYEECWTSLRDFMGETDMPRVVNWISGPSRTADIEQTLIRGAHGPKKLCVIVYIKP